MRRFPMYVRILQRRIFPISEREVTRSTLRKLIALGLLLLTQPALAESEEPCDCSRIVGTCEARLSLQGNRVKVESNRQRCSRVTWYANEYLRITLLSGRETLEWRGPSEDPFLTVESCQVCRDMGASTQGVANTVEQCRHLERTMVIRDQEGDETRQLRDFSEDVILEQGGIDAAIGSLRQSIATDMASIREMQRASEAMTSDSNNTGTDAGAINKAAIVEFQDWIALQEAAIAYLHCRAR